MSKGKVTIKGFLDPRIGDEMVVGVIEGEPVAIAGMTEEELNTHCSQTFAVSEMTKGLTCRQSYIEWPDGSKTAGFSGSGPGPDYPAPKRAPIKAQRVPLLTMQDVATGVEKSMEGIKRRNDESHNQKQSKNRDI